MSLTPSATTADQARPRLISTVLSRSSLSRCVPIALVVGTLLSLVNQGTVILAGDQTWLTWLQIAVNYVVPFCVSSAGFLSSQRSLWRQRYRSL